MNFNKYTILQSMNDIELSEKSLYCFCFLQIMYPFSMKKSNYLQNQQKKIFVLLEKEELPDYDQEFFILSLSLCTTILSFESGTTILSVESSTDDFLLEQVQPYFLLDQIQPHFLLYQVQPYIQLNRVP